MSKIRYLGMALEFNSDMWEKLGELISEIGQKISQLKNSNDVPVSRSSASSICHGK